MENENQCYLSMVEKSWLWHRRLGHLGFYNLAKISNEGKLSDLFLREVVYTVDYILNRGQLRVNKDKTPYELWYGRPASVKYFKVFGSNCYIKRTYDLGKFDSRIDEGIFLGYSSTKKAYRCYNKRLHKIVESADVKVDDAKPR